MPDTPEDEITRDEFEAWNKNPTTQKIIKIFEAYGRVVREDGFEIGVDVENATERIRYAQGKHHAAVDLTSMMIKFEDEEEEESEIG